MGNRQTEFLNDIYKKYIRTEEIKNFSLFITCRNNRIGDVKELTPRYINVNSLNEGQIKQFVEKYNGVKGENNYINLLQELKDVVGIPIILYIILAKKIEIQEETNLVNIYDMIFLPSSPYNIYSRSKYDATHVITSEEKNQIYDFSKKVSLKMWSDNPNEASLRKQDYETIAENIIGKEKSKDLLIGQYFVEGKDACELYFVHRSMYQYFVALSIFDAIQGMMRKGSPSDKFEELQNNFCTLKDSEQKNPEITSFAEIIGIDLICEDPDIEQYLLYMLENRHIEDNQSWKKFFTCFLDKGLTRYVDDYKENSLECFNKEMNRFYNLIWLTREQLRRADRSQLSYKVAEIDEKLCFYLRQRNKKFVDLIEINLYHADLSGAYLSGGYLSGADLRRADLRRADLSDAFLKGAYLNSAYLSGADLSGADLRRVHLSGAYLSGGYLREADLREADLRGADLSEAYLSDADLSEADLRGADLSEADLRGTELSEADLRGAYLSEADLREANLHKADLSGAILDDITVDKDELRKAILDEENYKKFFGDESESNE